MSRLLKALQKANKEHVNVNESHAQAKSDQSAPAATNDQSNVMNDHSGSMHEHTIAQAEAKRIDLQTIFTGMLIILVAVGIYFNFNISSNIASTKNGMAAISDNFRAQELKFEKLNKSILQMESDNSGQTKEFLSTIEKLSVSVASQIDEIQSLSKAQYHELSKTIEDQEKSITVLTGKYDQLDKTVRNYSEVNNSYVEQLNALKKKLAEINSAEVRQ